MTLRPSLSAIGMVIQLLFLSLIALHGAQVSAATPSERLALIKQRGTVIVGVKTDYPPFGQLNAASEPIGFEHDLAADIALRLGVKLIKVSVSASNRLQKLQENAVDIVIATTGDTEDRRKIVTMVEPNYYASGVTLFMPPHEHLKDWADARGKKVCATQGAYFNRTMQERYLLDLKTFNSARDAKLALRNGQCIGFLFDNTAIMNDLANPDWHGYQAPLPPALTTPWAIAIAARERGSDFDVFLGDTVADWHRSGFLIAREKAWHISPSQFLADANDLWQKQADDDQPLCRRDADGHWIAECRNKVFLTSADVGGLARLGLLLNERSGIDLSIVYDRYDRKKYLFGLALTLFLTVLCIAGSLSIGVTGAVLADSSGFLLAGLVRAGSAVGRMTPPLLSIYLLLFGIGAIGGLALPAIPVVIWCLSFYTGSGVMTALIEAAATYRIKHPDYRMRFTNVHDLARLASGSVTASLINVSKATMVASAVAVPELLSAANTISSERGNTGVTMTALLLTFLALIFCVVRLLRRLEALILARYAHV